MHFLSIICGLLVLVGGLASAQETPLQGVPRHVPPQRVRPRPPADPWFPDPAPTNQAVSTAQQPAVQTPAGAPQSASSPASSPDPVTQTPEQLPPPMPPQVTYRNGLLTVQAMNSTLGGLLTAIRNKTGIQFEGLENGAPERVAVSLGPAPEGEVLATILGGSKFDYVVLDRPDSPGTVQRVLLTPRGGASSTNAGAQPPRPANPQGEGDDEDAADEQASGDPEPQDTPVRPPLTQVQQQPQQAQPQEQISPKTPEQLLEQLKQMQQQQQQQQPPAQNQAPKPPPTPQL